MKNNCTYIISIGVFFLCASFPTKAQDLIYLKDGSAIVCKITEISDFILYADVPNDPYEATFFSDDVSHLNIDPNNTIIIRQLKKGVKDAMKFSNPLKENSVYGFYFGMPYDSVKNYTFSDALQKNDSLGNPILLPYDPQKTSISDRLKSLGRSLGGQPLTWLIGIL